MSTLQDPRKTWLATGNLLTVSWRMPSLGRRLSLFPALAVNCLPLCIQWGEGPACSQLALPWFSLGPLFCEQARLCLIAFLRKVLSLHPPAIPEFGLLSHISSLRLSSGHSALVLTLGMQPMSPSSAPAGGCELLGCFSPGSCS